MYDKPNLWYEIEIKTQVRTSFYAKYDVIKEGLLQFMKLVFMSHCKSTREAPVQRPVWASDWKAILLLQTLLIQ